MRVCHIGCYGIPGMAIPGALPSLDSPAPETTALKQLCSWMPRIRAAGFDCVLPEVRTPAMIDGWLGVIKSAAERAGLRFGTSWQFHDEASVIWPEWCGSPTWGKDSLHPIIRRHVKRLCEEDTSFDILELAPVRRLIETFGGVFLANLEVMFAACSDFTPAMGTTIGTKLGKWLRSLADDGHVVLLYCPRSKEQVTSSGFEQAAHNACYPLIVNHQNVRYCRTAGTTLNNDATFRNHAAANRWGITTAEWRSIPATVTNPAVLSVAFDKIDAVLRDMGV